MQEADVEVVARGLTGDPGASQGIELMLRGDLAGLVDWPRCSRVAEKQLAWTPPVRRTWQGPSDQPRRGYSSTITSLTFWTKCGVLPPLLRSTAFFSACFF